MTCNLTNREKHIFFNETFNLSSEVCIYLCIILHRVSMTVLLFIASRDWETVQMLSQETVRRNRINLALREKVLNSHDWETVQNVVP